MASPSADLQEGFTTASYETLCNDLHACSEAYTQLEQHITKTFASQVPRLDDLKAAIAIYQARVTGFRGLPVNGQSLSSGSDRREEQRGTNSYEPSSREDALVRLEAIARYFRRTERHSPIAYLAERALRWAAMPLDQWLQEVIQSRDVRDSILRDMLGVMDAETNDQ